MIKPSHVLKSRAGKNFRVKILPEYVAITRIAEYDGLILSNKMGRFCMKEKEYLSVSNFAKIARISVHRLRHYDQLGLLSPVVRGKNKYRFYSMHQLAPCNTIRILRNLGVPISVIRDLKDYRTPEIVEEVLARQVSDIQDRKEKLCQAEKLLDTMLQNIRSAKGAEAGTIMIQYLPAQPIMLGEQNDYSEGRTDYDALLTFYQTMSEKYPVSDCDVSYPVWGLISEDRVRQGRWEYPDRFYYFSPNGNDSRPAALYAIGYMRAGYGGGGGCTSGWQNI